MKFLSTFDEIGKLELPAFSGTRVMMLPLVVGDMDSIPPAVAHYDNVIRSLFDASVEHRGQVVYLTIDEKELSPGATHRRRGIHVDCILADGRRGGWSPAPWARDADKGMLTIASHAACRAWKQEFDGKPGYDGDCRDLAPQCQAETVFQPNTLYSANGRCVHESMPVRQAVKRQFVRLSMPSNAPWFDGYTENSKGVRPTGPVLSRRQYM